MTGAAFHGDELVEQRARLHIGPHFPVGITYPEMFSWGGMSSKTKWDWGLLAERRENDILTFGTGIAGAFFRGVLDRQIDVRFEHAVVELELTGDAVTGVRCDTPDGPRSFDGTVILATGAHDWSLLLSSRFTGIPAAYGGSLAPPTVSGDAIALVEAAGGYAAAIRPWAAPVLPGYLLPHHAADGSDTGLRACFEHCLPHTFIVNADGERFCDDSFHPAIVASVLGRDRADGSNGFPIYMIWDSQHRDKYGLGQTMPGEPYEPDLVNSSPTLEGLAASLRVAPDGLIRTAERFNEFEGTGEDPDFGRGSNLSARRFRGDWQNSPNPCIGSVSVAPFFGMQLRLLNTGIAAAGVVAGESGRVLNTAGQPIPGLYGVGECAARLAAGVGYNSGYSLSRAMAFGYLAARDVGGAVGD